MKYCQHCGAQLEDWPGFAPTAVLLYRTLLHANLPPPARTRLPLRMTGASLKCPAPLPSAGASRHSLTPLRPGKNRRAAV